MPSPRYNAPTTIEDAVRALAATAGAAKPLAGGTDLLVQLLQRLFGLPLAHKPGQSGPTE